MMSLPLMALRGEQDNPIADEAGGELVSTACAADTWSPIRQTSC